MPNSSTTRAMRISPSGPISPKGALGLMLVFSTISSDPASPGYRKAKRVRLSAFL